jgi:tRNA/tmRNA/rRNA uracil-C5-methylase (TrmA/RlmC/RlmD family)
MDETVARFLVSAAGRELLGETSAQASDAMRLTLWLRKQGHDSETVAGIVTVVQSRQRARKRFPDADHLFFTEDALAQATSPGIAAYHARYLAKFGTVADLGCGVGMDAIALAKAGATVLAIERDPARLIFAQANAEVCGVADRINFRQGDVTTLDWEADAVYWDPSRRDDATRFSAYADRYEPPLSFLDTIRARVRGGAVKLSLLFPTKSFFPRSAYRKRGPIEGVVCE